MTQTEDYIKEFNEKNEFLLGPKSAFDFQEIYLADFLKYVFARDTHDTDPFEETLSSEYLAWRKKKVTGLKGRTLWYLLPLHMLVETVLVRMQDTFMRLP